MRQAAIRKKGLPRVIHNGASGLNLWLLGCPSHVSVSQLQDKVFEASEPLTSLASAMMRPIVNGSFAFLFCGWVDALCCSPALRTGSARRLSVTSKPARPSASVSRQPLTSIRSTHLWPLQKVQLSMVFSRFLALEVDSTIVAFIGLPPAQQRSVVSSR